MERREKEGKEEERGVWEERGGMEREKGEWESRNDECDPILLD